MAKFRNGNLIIESGQSIQIGSGNIVGVSGDTDLSEDSDDLISTQKATKAYVDAKPEGLQEDGVKVVVNTDSFRFHVGSGDPDLELGQAYDLYFDKVSRKLWSKDLATFGTTLFTETDSCSASIYDYGCSVCRPFYALYEGDSNEGWRMDRPPGGVPQWWKYDFGEGGGVVLTKIYMRAMWFYSSAFGDFIIQGSLDDITWTNLYVGYCGHTNGTEYEFANTVPYRYYRIYVTSLLDYGDEWGIYNIKAYAIDTVDWQVMDSTVTKDGDIISINSDSTAIVTLSNDTGMQLMDGGASVREFSTDNTLADGSNSKVPTEKAIKEYIDARVDEILTGYGLIP